jgi:hypothetical protein
MHWNDLQTVLLAPFKCISQFFLTRPRCMPCRSHEGNKDLALSKHSIPERVFNIGSRKDLLFVKPRFNAA